MYGDKRIHREGGRPQNTTEMGEIQREAIGRWGVIPSRPARRKHQTLGQRSRSSSTEWSETEENLGLRGDGRDGQRKKGRREQYPTVMAERVLMSSPAKPEGEKSSQDPPLAHPDLLFARLGVTFTRVISVAWWGWNQIAVG